MEPPKLWREKRERYLAIGVQCTECGHKNFPSTQLCLNCGGSKLTEYKLAEFGEIISFTMITQTAPEMEKYLPYAIALIKLDDGVKITAQVIDVDYDKIKEGMKVRMVFRILSIDGNEGLIRYGFKFIPC
jgi:uncharacterized OB-fold protein